MTLGQGPGVDAFADGPALAADLTTPVCLARWPAFAPRQHPPGRLRFSRSRCGSAPSRSVSWTSPAPSPAAWTANGSCQGLPALSLVIRPAPNGRPTRRPAPDAW
jgi:hypothetical protein